MPGMKIVTVALTAWTLLLAMPVHSAQKECDRQCLINIADDYLTALVAHDPDRVSLAGKIRMVENLIPIQPGEGLWQTASALPAEFRIYVPDPVSQQIGFMVVMQESQGLETGVNRENRFIQVALRLQLEANEIVEAEHLINRDIDDVAMSHLLKPRVPLLSAVPPEYRNSRQRLLAIGRAYYDALEKSNGALAPFADDCVRHENGHQTSRNPIPDDPFNDFAVFASMGCAAQLNTQIYQYIDSIDKRRVSIADEETGLVFALSHFRQAMGNSPYKTIGVPGHSEFIDERDSYDLPAVHLFKIWGGNIHEVEAIGYFADYMATTGWE